VQRRGLPSADPDEFPTGHAWFATR
jgi:hypothetical protein